MGAGGIDHDHGLAFVHRVSERGSVIIRIFRTLGGGCFL